MNEKDNISSTVGESNNEHSSPIQEIAKTATKMDEIIEDSKKEGSHETWRTELIDKVKKLKDPDCKDCATFLLGATTEGSYSLYDDPSEMAQILDYITDYETDKKDKSLVGYIHDRIWKYECEEAEQNEAEEYIYWYTEAKEMQEEIGVLKEKYSNNNKVSKKEIIDMAALQVAIDYTKDDAGRFNRRYVEPEEEGTEGTISALKITKDHFLGDIEYGLAYAARELYGRQNGWDQFDSYDNQAGRRIKAVSPENYLKIMASLEEDINLFKSSYGSYLELLKKGEELLDETNTEKANEA
ncbi:hypothetical protein IJU22_01180 [Candidatus Saccharibacteria bacterium]|nr:hypothetical protein [Candidatus Saccharibacteria bacterium]